MKKVKFHVLIALCAMMLGLNLTSCKKEKEPEPEPQPSEEFTIIGNWKSIKWQEIDEDGIDEEYYGGYYVIFTENTAKIHFYDCNDGEVLESDYTFKETDDSIIYFPKAYTDYGYKIVGQVFKDSKQLIIEIRHGDWDWYERYYFAKQ